MKLRKKPIKKTKKYELSQPKLTYQTRVIKLK
jgi:hypothetical protein